MYVRLLLPSELTLIRWALAVLSRPTRLSKSRTRANGSFLMGCISCKRCCIWGHAVLCESDILRISSYLGLPIEQFIVQFTDESIWTQFSQRALLSDINSTGCIFLSNIGCTIYPVRPDGCATFPRKDHMDDELTRICERAKEMQFSSLTKSASDTFKRCAFRFFDGGGYGINFRDNTYYFLDEMGARLVRETIDTGLVDTKSIAAEYEIDESVIIEDASVFLEKFTNVAQAAANSETSNLADESFFRYFAENLIPLTVIIEITEACNEHCIHCYRPPPKREYWTPEGFKKACAELAAMGALQMDLTGGEPFLKKDILQYLEIADSYGFIISILTNATQIDDKAIDVLKSIKLRSLYVSIYSADAETHDLVTRLPGSFKRTLDTITKLKAHGLQVFLNSPVMDVNRNSPAGIKALADNLGLDVKFTYKISESYSQDRSTKQLNVFSESELTKMIEDPRVRLYAELIERKKMGGKEINERLRSCDTGFRSITISPEGDIIPCTALRMKCGNIGVEDIASLWETNENMNYWRHNGSLVKDGCRSCSSYDFCEPCPAGYFSTHGNLDGVDEITCGFGKVFSSCVSCKTD